MFTELSELGKTQSDQVARTVAYSTNQVMKLHQDVMSISNVLMAGNFSGGVVGPWNSSTSSTVSTTRFDSPAPVKSYLVTKGKAQIIL